MLDTILNELEGMKKRPEEAIEAITVALRANISYKARKCLMEERDLEQEKIKTIDEAIVRITALAEMGMLEDETSKTTK